MAKHQMFVVKAPGASGGAPVLQPLTLAFFEGDARKRWTGMKKSRCLPGVLSEGETVVEVDVSIEERG